VEGYGRSVRPRPAPRRARPGAGTFATRPTARPGTLRATLLVAGIAVLAAGCGDDESGSSGSSAGAVTSDPAGVTAHAAPGDTTLPADGEEQRFPDVVGAEATYAAGSWTFAVTISSPYDSPERYADAWRVLGPDGTVYGERILLHDHAAEQPFTRSRSGIVIPDGVTTVLIEARDLVHGWGGGVLGYDLPPRPAADDD
jgi:hypothetical protein